MTREYGLLGGRTHVIKRWRQRRWMWKAGVEWKAADLWVGLFHRPIGAGREVWLCLVPCLPFHVEWWDIGPAEGGEGSDRD